RRAGTSTQSASAAYGTPSLTPVTEPPKTSSVATVAGTAGRGCDGSRSAAGSTGPPPPAPPSDPPARPPAAPRGAGRAAGQAGGQHRDRRARPAGLGQQDPGLGGPEAVPAQLLRQRQRQQPGLGQFLPQRRVV